jgi:hypothetical protein
MNKKIIAISLYGNADMYVKGLMKNIELAPEIFPGWTMKVYYDDEKLNIKELTKRGCEVVLKTPSREHSGMFWRFLAAWDKEAERVIFRDADSRLNIKEAAAVKAWEESDLMAHTMHDHPHHACLPIFGGMWGIKCGVLPDKMYDEVVRKSRSRQKRVDDMYWLKSFVHPIIKNSLLRHSSVKIEWPFKPFPEHPKYDEFVGQQYDNDGKAIWPKV